jgi:hypothetical protein
MVYSQFVLSKEVEASLTTSTTKTDTCYPNASVGSWISCEIFLLVSIIFDSMAHSLSCTYIILFHIANQINFIGTNIKFTNRHVDVKNLGLEIFNDFFILFTTLPNYVGFRKGYFHNEIMEVPYISSKTFCSPQNYIILHTQVEPNKQRHTFYVGSILQAYIHNALI